MTSSFGGRAAVVTGASSGIGRAVAIGLGQAGMEQWLVGRSAAELDKTARAIAQANGGPAHCLAMDLRDRGHLGNRIRRIGEDHPYLFAVINCAGVMYPEPILSAQPERWSAMFDVNVMALLEACQAAVQVMRGHGAPANIINISSSAGRVAGRGAYSASKAAVDMIGHTLRVELENDDIRVTTIVPGPFETGLSRGFEPESLAALQRVAAAKGVPLSGPAARRYLGDPVHIAQCVRYVLEQPTEINYEEIVIRPPADIR